MINCFDLCDYIFRISNTSINAPNGALAPVTEENEAADAQNILNPDKQDLGLAPAGEDGAYVAPGQAMATQEGMEGTMFRHW